MFIGNKSICPPLGDSTLVISVDGLYQGSVTFAQNTHPQVCHTWHGSPLALTCVAGLCLKMWPSWSIRGKRGSWSHSPEKQQGSQLSQGHRSQEIKSPRHPGGQSVVQAHFTQSFSPASMKRYLSPVIINWAARPSCDDISLLLQFHKNLMLFS